MKNKKNKRNQKKNLRVQNAYNTKPHPFKYNKYHDYTFNSKESTLAHMLLCYFQNSIYLHVCYTTLQ